MTLRHQLEKSHNCRIDIISIMKKSSLELRSLLISGGSLIVDASAYSPLELKSLAIVAKANGSKITIRNASLLSTLECRSIAIAGGKGTITFEMV